MITDEIIGRLDGLMHHPDLTDLCEDAEGTRETEQALTAAIQAVKTVAAVNAAYEERDCGSCYFCSDPKGKDADYSSPCYGCDDLDSGWSLRWPLAEEETQ